MSTRLVGIRFLRSDETRDDDEADSDDADSSTRRGASMVRDLSDLRVGLAALAVAVQSGAAMVVLTPVSGAGPQPAAAAAAPDGPRTVPWPLPLVVSPEAEAAACLSDAPPFLCCPITGALMREPAVTRIGTTYERAAIQRWLGEHRTDPLTNEEIAADVVPNHALRSAIEHWLKAELRGGVTTVASPSAVAPAAAAAAPAAAVAAEAPASAPVVEAASPPVAAALLSDGGPPPA